MKAANRKAIRQVSSFIAITVLLVLYGSVLAADTDVSFSARILSCEGDTALHRKRNGGSVPCSAGMEIYPGDHIATGMGASVTLGLGEETSNLVKVGEDTQVALIGEGENKFDLVSGELITLLTETRKGREFRIKTPSAVCGARGTGWKTSADSSRTVVRVFEGSIFFRCFLPDGSLRKDIFTVNEGFERNIPRFRVPDEPARIPEKELEAIKEEASLMALVMGQFSDRDIMAESIEKKIDVNEQRMERAASRMERSARMTSAPMPVPVRGKRDDRERRSNR